MLSSMDDTQNQQPAEQEVSAMNESEVASGAQSSLEQRCEEYLAGWKRAQADYKNLQRDMEEQRSSLTRFANERLLRELLPALDQFSYAMRFLPSTEALPEEAKRSWDQWLVGVKAIQTLWEQAAQQAGLEPIPTDGAFDPQWHEAVSQEISTEVAEGSILRVLTPGWKLHGKVLQAARVVVAKAS
jgi:molecular chaperone GrpE